MEILAHRYLTAGKDKQRENTLSQLNAALQNFSFFETDIRRFPNGNFYISHDPLAAESAEHDARAHVRAWKSRPEARIALNLKELGYEKDLEDFLESEGVLPQVFLFDFELLGAGLEDYGKLLTSLNPDISFAARVSDHNEPVDKVVKFAGCKIVWLDEFEKFWATRDDIRALQKSGKKVYCISPDLHGYSLEQTKARWADFVSWGADGICTDYPMLLKEILDK